MGGRPCRLVQESRPDMSKDRISFDGGKILFDKEPWAMERSEDGSGGRDTVSPSSTTCSNWFVCCPAYLERVEQTHVGVCCSAHSLAASLWLQRLSMTEGYLVKTIHVEGS